MPDSRNLRGLAARGREALRWPIYARARLPRPLGTRPSITLAVCAIFRDEAAGLAEWVSFHRIQGAERFYLYNNLSKDDWREQLAPEIESGLVEVRDWSEVPGQGSAYDDCLRRHHDDTRWIAFIDVDEFLFSPTGRRLSDVLLEFGTVPAVVVNWRLYGSNGWEHTPDGLVVDNYPMRARDDHEANALIKSIVYPRMTLGVDQNPAHYFRTRGVPVDEHGKPALQHTRVPPTTDLLRINHYYAKSREQFSRKAGRPRADFGVVTDRPPDPPAEVRDDVIMQFAPDLRAVLAARVTRSGSGRH